MHEPDATQNKISKSELLNRVKSATSWHFKKALKYCLDQDIQSISQSGVSAYDQAYFYKKVIEPLDKHYHPLRQDRQDMPGFYGTLRRQAAILTDRM